MSLLDYLGQIIGFALVGLAVLGVAIAWIILYLVPKARDLQVHAKLDVETIEYNQKAKALVADLICDEEQLPAEIMDKVWDLQGLNVKKSGRKQISQ